MLNQKRAESVITVFLLFTFYIIASLLLVYSNYMQKDLPFIILSVFFWILAFVSLYIFHQNIYKRETKVYSRRSSKEINLLHYFEQEINNAGIEQKDYILYIDFFSNKADFENVFRNNEIIPRMAKHSSLVTILETAIKEAKEKIYDAIWCVFDRDVLLSTGSSKGLEMKFNEANRLDIQFADSLPAFEIWFLLHYVLPKQYYKNQDELINELQKYINNYSKDVNWLSRENLYIKLKPLVSNAIQNNIKLEQRIVCEF